MVERRQREGECFSYTGWHNENGIVSDSNGNLKDRETDCVTPSGGEAQPHSNFVRSHGGEITPRALKHAKMCDKFTQLQGR